MTRRRLRVVCSSDEEEDDQPPSRQQREEFEEYDDIEVELQDSTLNLETVTLNSSNSNPNLNPISAEPLQMSDDEFIDVSDNLSPPSPPHPPPPVQEYSVQSSLASAVGSSNLEDSSDCPISGSLRRMGLKLRREWLDSCIQGLEGSVPGFASFDVAAKAKLCFGQFLQSDMNYCGGGVLPANVHDMHIVDLAGPFVLQVDEIVNISCPLRTRYQNANSGAKRCLKLSMTDGVQRVFGMEYRPIRNLEVLAPAGLKVAIHNVNIRHGLLMLVPEVIEVLGGSVEELEAARQRLVCEVNKPPRGKRTRTGIVPPLATRATLAAWPSTGTNVPDHTHNSTSRAASPLQSDNQETRATEAGRPLHGNGVSGHTQNSTSRATTPLQSANQDIRATEAAWPSDGIRVQGHTQNSTSQAATPLQSDNQGTRATEAARSSDGIRVQAHTQNSTSRAATPLYSDNLGAASDFSPRERIMEDFAVPHSTDHTAPNSSSSVVFDKDIHMVDEIEHPVILRGDREIPFTYLSSLSAKSAAMKEKASSIRGKIKCFLTGVKGFQYRQRTTFELRVYVDDGSLISEVLVDHNVVQRYIGHSPEEVSAALVSSDAKRVSSMKETMKQFQSYLINFEGIMLVEINSVSEVPVAIEMNQGCTASDAWLLLRRLKAPRSTQPAQTSLSDPIELSP